MRRNRDNITEWPATGDRIAEALGLRLVEVARRGKTRRGKPETTPDPED